MKLSYEDYKRYHASKCLICNGEERVQRNGVWVCCGCQYSASLKWEYDQIEISPESIKYKTWDDFVGIGDSGTKLTDHSFVDAKTKALSYCFDSPDPSVIKDREKHSVVLNHIKDAQNVIITGGPHSGKSLVATLILKEIIYAGIIKHEPVNFKWIRGLEIIDAALWDGERKTIDRDFLDEASSVKFLFIDGIDLKSEIGNHPQAPDIMQLNRLFSKRLGRFPTILICSDNFWTKFCSQNHYDIRTQWGEDFYALLKHKNNLVIELRKEDKRV